jgi:hypothetical protein
MDALKPTLATQQFGSENILAALVAEAALSVMPTLEEEFCVDDVRCVYKFSFFLWCVGMKTNTLVLSM